MALQYSEHTLENLLHQIDVMATELQVIRNTVETLLTADDRKGGTRRIGESTKRSVVEILAAAPGHRVFSSAEEVDRYLSDERTSWDN